MGRSTLNTSIHSNGVPFSCCSLKSLFPCDNIDFSEDHVNSVSLELTVNTVGCGNAVSSFINYTSVNVLRITGVLLVIIQVSKQCQPVDVDGYMC
jgi:hypothetical protein